MNDLDPSQATSLEELVRCLQQLHIRADRPSFRVLEDRTKHANGVLPGTRIQRVPLRRSTLGSVLHGQLFPRKAFLLTFVEACGVDLETDRRWEQAWDRLAENRDSVDRTATRQGRQQLEDQRQRFAGAEQRTATKTPADETTAAKHVSQRTPELVSNEDQSAMASARQATGAGSRNVGMTKTREPSQNLLTERIKAGRELLQRSAAPDLDTESLLNLWTEFNHWRNNNRIWLGNHLGREVRREYEEILNTWRDSNDVFLKTELMANALPWEISTLESIRDRLPSLLSAHEAKSFGSRASHDAPIFIVHGIDTLRAESVAHTVASATGRETIILHDQPNSGRTLIEKFEEHAAAVSYAIIVLTADDKGSRADETGARPRGQQNVILEMGYFYGLIGRDRVSVLLRPGVEKPSDMDGIVYITFDDNRAWKTELLRELKHAGFDVHF